MKNFTVFIFFVSTNILFAQEKYVRASNGCVSGKAEVAITTKGIYGALEVTSNCTKNVYVEASAYVEVLEVRESSKAWNEQSIGTGGLFIKPGTIVTVDREATDKAWLNGTFTDLRKISMYIAEPGRVSKYQPNANCFKVKLGTTTQLFQYDNLVYSIKITRGETKSGLWSYNGALIVSNNNPGKVKYQSPVRYEIWFDGIAFRHEAKFKTVKDIDEDFFASARFNYTPSVYIEFTDVPALAGNPPGNQINSIPKPIQEPSQVVSNQNLSSSGNMGKSVSTGDNNSSIDIAGKGFLLINSDATAKLYIDGTEMGLVEEGKSYKAQVGLGEHLVKLISTMDPGAVFSEVVDAKDGTQKVVLVKLMTPQIQAMKRQQALAIEKEKAKKAEEEQAALSEAQAARLKKLAENRAEQNKIRSQLPRKYVLAKLWEPDISTPKEWEIKPEDIGFDTENFMLVGSLKCTYYGDSILTLAGEKYYSLELLNQVRDSRVRLASKGGIHNEKYNTDYSANYWILRYSDKEYLKVSFYEDGTADGFLSQKRRIIGSKLNYQKFSWSWDGKAIKIANDEEEVKFEVLDFFPGKALVIKHDDEVEIMEFEKY